MSITEGFNYWIQKAEDFNFSIGKWKIGFHDKTLKVYRIITLMFVILMSVFWVFTGYETTILRLFTKELPVGVGIHYGTLIFTLSSFIIVSYSLQKIGITKLRNLLYSFILATGLINGLFECGYALLYDVIHHGELWITAPFLYSGLGIFRLYPTYRNWYWLIFGLIFLWLIKGHYRRDFSGMTGSLRYKLKWRNPFNSGNKWLLVSMIILGYCWLMWIYYPYQAFIQVRGKYFPQYIYGFREYEQVPNYIPEENIITLVETNWKAVYVPNLGVRIVNEITKLFHFIFFTYFFIPKWRRIK